MKNKLKQVMSFTCAGHAVAAAWSLVVFASAILGVIVKRDNGFPIVAAAALSAFLLVVVSRYLQSSMSSSKEGTWDKAGMLLLFLFSALTYWWANSFSSGQASDFGLYYRCGINMRGDLPDWISRCQSKYFHQQDKIYWLRSIFYTAPFGVFFGDNYQALKLYNAFLHVLTMVVFFIGARRYLGARAATVALFFFGLYPEWLFSVTVATPDNLAILCVISFLLLVPYLFTAERMVAPAVALTLVMFVGHASRTVGPIFLVTLLLVTLLGLKRKDWKGRISRFSIVVLLYGLVSFLFKHWAGGPEHDQYDALSRLSTIDFNQPLQNYRLIFAWVDQFLPAVPEAFRTQVAFRRLAFEFAHGFAQFPQYLVSKAYVVFAGNGYYFFASSDIGFNPDSMNTQTGYTVPISTKMTGFLAVWGLVYIFLTAFSMMQSKESEVSRTSVVFVTAFLLIIVGLGDVQARYSLVIAPALSLITATTLFASGEPQMKEEYTAGGRWLIIGGALIASAYVIGAAAASKLSALLPAPLASARQEVRKLVDGKECNAVKARVEANYKHLSVTPDAGETCTSIAIPISTGARAVSFFVARSELRFPFEGKSNAPYSYRVEYRGKQIFESTLADENVKWHLLDLPEAKHLDPEERQLLVVTILKNRDAEWSESVDFWFMVPRGEPLAN